MDQHLTALFVGLAVFLALSLIGFMLWADWGLLVWMGGLQRFCL